MARQERFVNNADDTLSSGITDSATSLSVNSATGFPTEGDFRIIIGSEILLVTAVSGTTFTVERGAEGTTAAAHSSSDPVTAILTSGALDQYLRDRYPYITAPPFRIVDTNGAFLDSSDFTEVNFAENAASSDEDGNITITKDDHGSNSISALIRTAPSTPYTITAAFTYQILSDFVTDGPSCGLCFRESSTADIIVNGIYTSNTSGISVVYYDSPTVAGGSTLQAYEPNAYRMPMWQRIEDDGTNIKFYVSRDGITWVQQHSELRGANFTTGPNQVGFFINNYSGVDGNFVSLIAWDGE